MAIMPPDLMTPEELSQKERFIELGIMWQNLQSV